jgi:nucleoside-diphosphate-sugar epimerase
MLHPASQGGIRVKVFVTGGSGYLGRAVVAALREAGHQVTGLARSAEAAAVLQKLGARAVIGELSRPASFTGEAAGDEAIVHIAQDFNAADRSAADIEVIDALLRTRERGLLRAFVYTSNAFLLGDQGIELNEDDAWPHPPRFGSWRLGVEDHVLRASTPEVATSVVRPGQIYGGRGGSLGMFFESAAQEGAVAYVGDGRNVWSMVHREDLAALYERILEGGARGIFHGVDGASATVLGVARAASEAAGCGGKVRSISLESASREWGSFAQMLCLDTRVGARRARALGWVPTHLAFVEGARAYWAEWLKPGADRL